MNIFDALSLIKKGGNKITKVRRETINIVFNIKKPLSVPQILELLKEKSLRINKSTLYREINFLLGKNIISQVKFDAYITYYEAAHLAHHHHLVCDVCGDIQEVASQKLETSIRKVVQEVLSKNFYVKRHNLEFFGECKNCITK